MPKRQANVLTRRQKGPWQIFDRDRKLLCGLGEQRIYSTTKIGERRLKSTTKCGEQRLKYQTQVGVQRINGINTY
ncbi:hypothetical protein DPMN_143941 [Dreissena polymorpha]|uniref:Uncharacterized protein n=1 Tax=Dreissena polymorpha TaxID=45954 RepID=A0A9D4JNQ1_DREPO|nr:hypothetical protein DPMN_143941 [Dreissena polymorpha]